MNSGSARNLFQSRHFQLGRILAGSAFIYAASSALAGLVPLILLPLLTRLLSPEEYGRVAMFSVFIQFLAPIIGLSVHGAVGMRYFQRNAINFPSYVATCMVILAISCMLTLTGVLILSPFLSEWTGIPANWLLLATLACGFSFLVQTQLAIWQSGKQVWRFASLRATQSILDLCLSIFLVLSLGMAWQGRAGGMVFALAACAIIALFTLRRGGWLSLPIRMDHARNALGFGLPLIPHAIGGTLIAMVDRFMITNLLSVAETGVYFVAIQVGLVVQLVAESINRAISPWLIENLAKENRHAEKSIVKFTYIYFIFLIVMGIIAGLLAPIAIKYLSGKEFHAAGSFVIYITIGQSIGGMYLVVSNYVFWAGNTGRLALISLTSGIINVILSYWLLKLWGLSGSAVAFLIAQCLLFGGTWWLAAQSRPMPWLSAMRRRS